MTIEQYNSIMANVEDVNEDIYYFFTSENTKIMPRQYPKIELDEGTELLYCYILHPNSTEDNPIYVLSFVCTLDSIFAVCFNVKDGTMTSEGEFRSTIADQVGRTYSINNYN